jgi:hypothetical protein
MPTIPKCTVAEALEDRFREGTTPRSPEYRRGFSDMLTRKIDGTPLPPQPFPDGSVQADAYWSGWDGANSYLAARIARDEPLFEV